MPHNLSAESDHDSALTSLQLLLTLHRKVFDTKITKEEFLTQNVSAPDERIRLTAKKYGLKSKSVRLDWDGLNNLAFPCIACLQHGRFCVVAGFRQDKILVHDPYEKRPLLLPREIFTRQWNGQLILFKDIEQPFYPLKNRHFSFGFHWFWPALKRHRKLFIEILLASFVAQCLSLVTPLTFQVIVDKVLAHNTTSTLTVIGIAMLGIAVFETLLTFLRNYVSSHTSSRIDILLGARLFRHLMSLPLGYFEARRVGDTVARVRELDTIRQFLTGSSMTLAIDVVFSLLFIGILFIYSPLLTAIVAITIPIYLLVSLSIFPFLRKELNQRFDLGARNQAFMVETVTAVQSVKSLSIENTLQKKWENQLAGFVSAGFRSGHLANLTSQLAALVNRLSIVLVLWVGALQVMQQNMTVGQLIAFNMIAMRISAPILRLVQLWQDFQQTGISLERLGEVLNFPTENQLGHGQSVLPEIKGEVELKNVTFRFKPDRHPVFSDLSLRIMPGEVIGIAGASGSGKSTVARLLQRFYLPEMGQILIDGHDVNGLDPAWLRKHVAVVGHDNVLFNLTIRENIALAAPGLTDKEILKCARLAGADPFIRQLPAGYETLIEEQGGNLSHGQRQRIALAQALATNPAILVLDEFTSALDAESEKTVLANLREICAGRTVLMIAHRLYTLANADRLMFLANGKLTEVESYEALLAKDGFDPKTYRVRA